MAEPFVLKLLAQPTICRIYGDEKLWVKCADKQGLSLD